MSGGNWSDPYCDGNFTCRLCGDVFRATGIIAMEMSFAEHSATCWPCIRKACVYETNPLLAAREVVRMRDPYFQVEEWP